ncbi:hypothetical protein MKX19_10405 [Acinetobacter pittii]|jgi:hypothetical protein|uniref:hypothetical protein n=1 Tax=Acinetobacter TaxID=469 RepID=UPI000346CB09|nr:MULTISPECIES: hypothetical protein [Acinetobacter]MDR0069296.1 hypothetical protein [Acinetobacter sp. 11520]AVZ04031.1 hypothetical protein DBQ26_04985 [Acinetobacter pittii]KQE05621.1 hypothetical protein APD35_15800 [Acinetobacter pittii]KQG37222.1 hypothetical protein APC39_12085 [Acinetobacter pittii]MBN6508091.1 hypothetical protein [Acinetobacter pittii]
MNRFIDEGISGLSLLKPEIWVHCPKCQKLAKIIEIKERELETVRVFCTHCTYRKTLQHIHIQTYDYMSYYFNLNENMAEWSGACEVKINAKCTICKEGKYKYLRQYARKSLIPREIVVSCNFCLRENRFDDSTYTLRKISYSKVGFDPYYAYRLFLNIAVRQGQICVYNPTHLEILKKFIQADLRERKFSNYNRSYFSRLPAWIKSTRNRKEILKAILRLEQMASTIQPLTNK